MNFGRGLLFFYDLIRARRKLIYFREYLNSLDKNELFIAFATLLTTVELTLVNFVSKTKPLNMSDLFKNTTSRYVPFFSDDNLVICEITPNDANNPGNSIFGPKGVICPGNLVTSNVIKAVMALMNHFDYVVEGVPKFKFIGSANRIQNRDELAITL